MKAENIQKAVELNRQLNNIETYEESLIGLIDLAFKNNTGLICELHLMKHKDKTELCERYKKEISDVLNEYFNVKRIKYELESEKLKQQILKEIETL